MKLHTKIYMRHFGYDASDFIGCEVCGAQAVDIHHIHARGMGGTKEVEHINNLMALCRLCHFKHGDIKHQLDFLTEIHNEKLRNG